MKVKLNKTSRASAAVVPDTSRRMRHHTPMHLEKILVPVDFSSESKQAFQYAMAFAREFGASVTLLHVVEPIVYPSDVGYGPVVTQVPNNAVIKAARTRLKTLGKKLAGNKPVTETVVLSGSPWFEITEAAKALGIDMIAIATHGYTGLDHVLMGSTAEKVVRHAPCPVLVVRKGSMSLFNHDQIPG